ncbi:hypothetical protein HMPREF1536_01962 [Parabacteroides gordonii MS-1 = DSM 23371]|uniref:Uncharacterized protein n=1 Tax=Parabacteroides gordonii MS-1 = DSM 23371 TaxID=1203610 RepID=A0A0F5JHF7_9BACT|nr:hypothetical protein HMPREF1536_01962 [Parabacteroides gordonii MS-1 = DSM 23371]
MPLYKSLTFNFIPHHKQSFTRTMLTYKNFYQLISQAPDKVSV